jgi:hypothetical protein
MITDKQVLLILLATIIMLTIILVAVNRSQCENNRTIQYTACYVCEDGKEVKYYGKDNYLKRKQAQQRHKCKVVNRTWKCDSKKVVKKEAAVGK